MKTTISTIVAALTSAQVVQASAGAASEGLGLFTVLFLALGALIVVFQLVPAITLFAGMVWSLFAGERHGAGSEAAGRR
jgi:hypothetical protein